MKSNWDIRKYTATRRGVTQTWIGLFAKVRTAEDPPEVPVMVCASWTEAHAILRWMQDNPQERFERDALRRFEASVTQRRIAAARSLRAGNREASKRFAHLQVAPI